MRTREIRRHWLGLLVVVAVAALACAGAASAKIVRATAIGTPGESGYVSSGGLLSGTGSPNLYDQQPLYVAFRRLDDQFTDLGSATTPKPGVTIVRDSYGIPTITGLTDDDAWWGAGYAAAQDRLWELEVFRRGATGHLAEILGKSYLDDDIEARRDYYTPRELDRQAQLMPKALRVQYAAYLGGVNAWVAKVQADSSLLPGEFTATGDKLTPFTIEDLYAIGVNLARTTPNGDGSELADAQALDELGPAKFNKILPLQIPGQISTIPRADGLFPSDPGRTAAQERVALKRSTKFVRGLPLPRGSQPSGNPGQPAAAADVAEAPIHIGGSSAIAVGSPSAHRAFLFNGPELGFQAPSEFWQLEVRGPGLDVRGATIPGAPIVGIGHTAHVAWGLTSSLTGENSLYADELRGGTDSDRYVFDGKVRTMSCRTDTFTYNTPPVAVLEGQKKQSGTVTAKLCRTVQGPVQARAGEIAYARRYATWGREIGTLAGLDALDHAETLKQVGRAAGKVTWSENITAADDRGNIGFWEPGLQPIRPAGWDERLPYPGTGQAEWRGFLPASERPHVIDPEQGWLTNWNTMPSAGWTNGNNSDPERAAGAWFRDAYLKQVTQRLMVRSKPSFAHLQAVVHQAGTTAQQRPLATADLRRALKGAHGHAKTVLRTILGWDGSYATTNAAGFVSPGLPAWEAFLHAAQSIALARLGRGAALIGAGGTNSDHVFDISLGQAYALRTLGPGGWRAAAARAFGVLAKDFKSGEPAHWQQKRTLAAQPVIGAEQPPPMPFFDRGTWEQFVELGR